MPRVLGLVPGLTGIKPGVGGCGGGIPTKDPLEDIL